VIDLFVAPIGVVLVLWLVLYGRGWLRLRRRGARLATVYRLVVFWVATILVSIALLSPVNRLSTDYLFVRSLQTVILCLMAAPAFFQSCGYDVMLWGLPTPARRWLYRTVNRSTRQGAVVRKVAPPGVAWLLFLALFLIWHDPSFVNWATQTPALHTAALLLLGLVALLFWWHVVGTGPRLQAPLAPWLIAIMLVITEIVNMTTGVSLAFATEPLYGHYAAVAAAAGSTRALGVLGDQALAGGIVWVAGSFVYISSIILVVNRLFVLHGGSQPEPYANWDADERMIMPGLEHRVRR